MADTSRRRRDQLGGAISLWVVLMVPVAAFAAVVAMAGPQRMAAESSMNEAADDLATLAVALRDGRGNPKEEIKGFLPACPRDPGLGPDLNPTEQEELQKELEAVCNLLLGDDANEVEGYLHRDLGYLGINTDSWEGFYTNSIFEDRVSNDPDTPEDESIPKPCFFADDLLTRDAVYVALAADWEDAGWAAAQAWPNGVRMGEELVARLNQRGSITGRDRCVPDRLNPPPQDPGDPNYTPPPRTAFSD
ncbi:hypothetical protein [Candidatus Poriferisocius sp.]|uniref:hypothetical protein n=1 Tax=Candidatus Poriferisocius sp. TaxID=3101276 RepID=UPI003B011DFD